MPVRTRLGITDRHDSHTGKVVYGILPAL